MTFHIERFRCESKNYFQLSSRNLSDWCETSTKKVSRRKHRYFIPLIRSSKIIYPDLRTTIIVADISRQKLTYVYCQNKTVK